MEQTERSRLMELGIEHCRMEQWEAGLKYLAEAFDEGLAENRLTVVASSYLGYAIARKGRAREGLQLCQRAVRKEFFQPETFFNLSRTHLLMGNRREAVRALDEGLANDPEHTGLLMLRTQMGFRRAAPLPFLSRENPINRFLGRLRHRLGR